MSSKKFKSENELSSAEYKDEAEENVEPKPSTSTASEINKPIANTETVNTTALKSYTPITFAASRNQPPATGVDIMKVFPSTSKAISSASQKQFGAHNAYDSTSTCSSECSYSYSCANESAAWQNNFESNDFCSSTFDCSCSEYAEAPCNCDDCNAFNTTETPLQNEYDRDDLISECSCSECDATAHKLLKNDEDAAVHASISKKSSSKENSKSGLRGPPYGCKSCKRKHRDPRQYKHCIKSRVSQNSSSSNTRRNMLADQRFKNFCDGLKSVYGDGKEDEFQKTALAAWVQLDENEKQHWEKSSTTEVLSPESEKKSANQGSETQPCSPVRLTEQDFLQYAEGLRAVLLDLNEEELFNAALSSWNDMEDEEKWSIVKEFKRHPRREQ